MFTIEIFQSSIYIKCMYRYTVSQMDKRTDDQNAEMTKEISKGLDHYLNDKDLITSAFSVEDLNKINYNI